METGSVPESSAGPRRIILGTGVIIVTLSFLVNPWVLEWVTGRTLISVGWRLVLLALQTFILSLGLLLLWFRDCLGLKELGLLAVTLLLCLPLGECLLSLLGIAPARQFVRVPPLDPQAITDERTGQRNNPHYPVSGLPMNPDGFADFHAFVAGQNDPDAWRILLLGDSFAGGAGAPNFEQSFGNLLEKELTRKKKTIIWKTGVPGIGQRQELYLLREYYPKLQPHLILLCFYENDFGDNLFPMGQYYVFKDGSWVHRYDRLPNGQVNTLSPEEAYLRAKGIRTRGDYLFVSRVISFSYNSLNRVADRIDGLWATIGAKQRQPPVGQPGEARSAAVASKENISGFEETRDLLRQIKSYLGASPSRLVMVLIPSSSDLSQPSAAYTNALKIAGELGIATVEIRDVLDATDYRGDGHWNSSGHRKVARRLKEVLEGRLTAWSPAGDTR